jgi:hypothetical protein
VQHGRIVTWLRYIVCTDDLRHTVSNTDVYAYGNIYIDVNADKYSDGNTDEYSGDVYTIQLDHLYGGRVAGSVHNHYTNR